MRTQVKGGAHLTFEIIPTYHGRAVAFRRQSIPGHERPPGAEDHPKGMLFFCHNLIRKGESMDVFVNRVVREQAGVGVRSWRIVNFESFWQKKDDHWALLGYVIADLRKMPKAGTHGNRVAEVVAFSPKNPPDGFAWWTRKEMKQFFERRL
ncbi:MAG: hypothetical protein HYS81_03665 [Candidatus Aenigmatarchaeota archaeon]|nr:MAG: hypothetical protein HYS81_03665 [Candidatus Aenigmarchaeota archaeon]